MQEPSHDVLDDTPAPIELARLKRDVRSLAGELGVEEARGLVDVYYQLQDYRKALANQARAAEQGEEPHALVDHFAGQMFRLERQMVAALDTFSDAHAVGRWSRQIVGIGPVLAAGVLAHVDIERAPTVGHIWRFAGLDPTVRWQKGEKRPWNARLKVLCWKIGDSFVKVSGRDDSLYGRIYRERKEQEVARNNEGRFADQAAKTLEERPNHKQRAIYEEGRLPDGRVDLRARRYAVKLYLSHWHHVAFVDRFGEDPPRPYALTQEGGHAHFVRPPNWS